MSMFSILAVSDLTPASEHALERAALLARQHQAVLRLAHFAEGRHNFFSDPVARLTQRSRQLARRHGIEAHALAASTSLDDLMHEARAASLLVMAPMEQRSWKTFHLGTTLDQVMQGSHCPLLLVKHAPRGPYQRVLVAVDLSDRTSALIDRARRFSAPCELQVFHAIDTIEESRLRSASVSFEAMQANRLGTRQHARTRLLQVIGALGMPDDDPPAFDVGNGDPAYSTALQQQAIRADLVVVGRRRRSSLRHFLGGSVAQRVAQWADSDVLVVPSEDPDT
ncbi:MAG: universal stress protein [Comamonadaceae bacterium]|nr:MAG: universal stress protein [Comamonadaceae bacterium]